MLNIIHVKYHTFIIKVESLLKQTLNSFSYKMHVCFEIAQELWTQLYIKSYFGPFQPKSWPKVKNHQKWSRIEHCSKRLQMSPNSHIKSYFGKFQPDSSPEVKNYQKWSRIEHCSKWLQMRLDSHIKSYFGPFQPKSWPKVKKIVKSEAVSNIAQNGSKRPLIVISSHIVVHCSQNVDQK